MNNIFLKKTEDEYKSGGINSFFYKKLKIKSESNANYFNYFLKKYKILTKLGVDSNEKFHDASLSIKYMKNLCGKYDLDVIKNIINNDYFLKNSNDFYYAILKESYKKSGIKKVAYPNMSLDGYEHNEPFDLNKWIEVVHSIYDSVYNKDMTVNNAIDYYSNSLDIKRNEDTKFKRWFKHYSSGEHLKYSKDEENTMKKKSVFMSGLSPTNPNYYHDRINNMPGDSISGNILEVKNRVKSDSLQSSDFLSWRSKLHTACRRIDKLLRSKCPPDVYRPLAQTLFDLSVQISELQPKTASDLTYKTANKFKKIGLKEEAEMLRKIAIEGDDLVKLAQDIVPPEGAQPPPSPIAAEEPTPGPAAEGAPPQPAVEGGEGVPPEEEAEKKSPIPSSDDVEPAKLEDIVPIPGAAKGEYAALAGDLTLSDASDKLDQVAGMLADRRVIRLLAEFDIMLDKLGIASMFPELAESQSKLIDSYSYALTRVTKMMGQLANAEALLSSQTGIPGVGSEGEAEVEQEEAPMEPVGAPQPEEV